ncbi:alpha/beta hydrolase [Frateuria hangzhouensis]|uniref:alpha/beta hydrolase n=1 Tax=Frateuria hangzhouensis TaxID=2995589 RepID=UPI002260DFF6|nr:alpha/beta hydrolase-fold protein [Frateuria sp. STR12]MCX7512302.1 alpha/beta hydrolase-fold protein [Frateuria sp. STR12]
MLKPTRGALALLFTGLLASGACAREAASTAHQLFQVSLPASADAPAAGRLLVFATEAKAAKAAAGDGKVAEVDSSPFAPKQTAVAAREVARLAPGHKLLLDADDLAFPTAFSRLPPGDYLVQAVLDPQHDYNYHGRNGGDLVSEVVAVHLPGDAAPSLALTRTLPERKLWDIPTRYMSQTTRKHVAQAREQVQPIDVVSPALSAFWGRPIHMRGWVVLPPGYDPHGDTTYPTVFQTHGYGGDLSTQVGTAAMVFGAMAEKQLPPMIWVVLDESSPTGTHEFADSVNNGPWGRALTTELIPALERQYRMDARPSGRFLTGHSSGGWATLWLQTRYPKVFGGTWSTSPDPSDFHDFTGVDLYAPGANVYHRADGTPYPLVRAKGKVIATFEDFARMERVLGPYGGQMASFEWVFSPRGTDGRPLPMFDRDTGEVDPAVIAYWREHYDIAHRLQRHWPELKPDLDGKIHLVVGTADTFYLDGAAHKLKAVLDGLGAKSDFRFLPDRTHGDLYVQGEDRQGLFKQMAWEMYAVARPQSQLKRIAVTP